MVKDDPAGIGVFVMKATTTLAQGPILHEAIVAEVTMKPDRGPLGVPGELAASIVVETVMPALPPTVCAPVVSPVRVTVCGPAGRAAVPDSVMEPGVEPEPAVWAETV